MGDDSDVRSKVISEFCGMKIDMDYALCCPSVHAVCGAKEAIVSLDETVREKSSGFPDKQLKLLIKWVALHRDEIINNHAKCNHSENPDAVRPLTKAQIIKIKLGLL